MALIEEYTSTTEAEFYSRMGAFLESNGYTVTNLTSSSVEFGINGRQYKAMRYASYVTDFIFGIWNGASYSTSVSSGCDHSTSYKFIMSDDIFFLVAKGSSTMLNCCGYIEEKIGDWAGGAFSYSVVDTTNNQYQFGSVRMHEGMRLDYEGSITPTSSSVVGAPNGFLDLWDDWVYRTPADFNGAIMPIPILVTLRGPSLTQFQPIGYIKNVFAQNRGNLFFDGDYLEIDGVQYFWVACTSFDYLIKI